MFDFFDPDSETTLRTEPPAPGAVRFDDRGNAIYEWRNAELNNEGHQAEKLRERALRNPALALVNDAPGDSGLRNEQGLRLGYNPYQSGQLGGKPAAKKRDIRELSKWIETQRRLGLLQPAKK